MTSKFYTYKVTFPGLPWFYYGVHKDNGKPYSGSPVTHKWIWDFYEYEVQVLEWFSSWDEALSVEKRLIKPFLKNPNCLNEHCGGNLSPTACKRGHDTMRKNQVGIFSPDFPRFHGVEVCSAAGKIGGKLPWWNNGTENTRSAQCPGEGWVQGRLVSWKWFNDGAQNVRSLECPRGFTPGRIMPRNKEGKFTT